MNADDDGCVISAWASAAQNQWDSGNFVCALSPRAAPVPPRPFRRRARSAASVPLSCPAPVPPRSHVTP